jgi:chemotaxis response regulator CheB
MTTPQKIVLVDGSRLLRGMFRRAIQRDSSLQVISEIDDMNDFHDAIKKVDADWIFLALPSGRSVPAVVDQTLREQPDLNMLVMDSDGSHLRMRWIETHETPLDEKNLNELLMVLRDKGRKEKASNSTERMDNA